MMAEDHNTPDDAVEQKKPRVGLNRIWYAAGYSLAGLRDSWGETAFRQEVLAAMVMIPGALGLGKDWVEITLLAGSVVLVLIVELLNTAVEIAINRIGPEWNILSKRAKDTASAAVLLALLLCGGIWLAALMHNFAYT